MKNDKGKGKSIIVREMEENLVARFNAFSPTITISSFIDDVSKLHDYTLKMEDGRPKIPVDGLCRYKDGSEFYDRTDRK